MKIAFITTVNHNVGDDFVREGIKYLLKKVIKDDIVFSNIHKHSPITSRNGFEWFRKAKYSKRVDKFIPLRLTSDKILEADIVIQSGAPVYWCEVNSVGHCYDNEWYLPLIQRRLSRNKSAKLFNIAAGTCLPYYSDGSELLSCKEDVSYIKQLHDRTALTTVRDKLAKRILDALNLESVLLPCTSIFAREYFNISKGDSDIFAINYMEKGAHYTMGQNIDAEKWCRTIGEFYKHVSKNDKVVFVCHSKNEVNEVKKIDSNAKIFISDNFIDYIKFYSNVKYAILNRVHGAFMLASYGKPSVVIGNDSRARMCDEISIKNYFINDINIDILMSEYSRLKASENNYEEEFLGIKKRAKDIYLNIILNHINKK